MGEHADEAIEWIIDRASGRPRRKPWRSPTLDDTPNPNTPHHGQVPYSEIGQLRHRAHVAFDRIWRQGHMTRSQAYGWLAVQLGIPSDEAHMGQMRGPGRLNRVIEVSERYMGSTAIQDDFPDDLSDDLADDLPDYMKETLL